MDLRLCSDGREGIRTRAYLSTWYGTLEPGDVLTGTAKFTSVFTLARDRASSGMEDGIFLAADVEVDAACASDAVPLHSIPARIGRKLKAQIDRFYGGEEAAVLRGLLTGDKTRLNRVASIPVSAARELPICWLYPAFMWASWPDLFIFCPAHAAARPSSLFR